MERFIEGIVYKRDGHLSRASLIVGSWLPVTTHRADSDGVDAVHIAICGTGVIVLTTITCCPHKY